MKELLVLNTNELVNKDLGKSIDIIQKELIKKDKSNFAIAKQVTKIINDELWTDDFETQNDIADFLGVSKSQISLMKNVTELKEIVTSKKANDTLKNVFGNYTMSRLFEINPLKKCVDDEHDIYFILNDFISYAKENEFDLVNSSKDELRAKVKAFRNAWNGVVETETTRKETSDTEPTQTSEEVETMDTDNTTVSDFHVEITIGEDKHIFEDKDFLIELSKLIAKYNG